MAEPRDEITEWLGREVQPLAPRPGTFARIQRRARRRKMNQALVTAASAVVVIAGAVLAPTVVPSLLHGGGSGKGSSAVGADTPKLSSRATPRPSKTSRPSPTTHSASELPTGTALSNTSSGTNPPPRFQPTSITMISDRIGAVIGQAGTPGQCGPPVAADCTSLAGTSTFGAGWYGVSAPVTGAPDGSTGVAQVRFLDIQHGWAFGPELWSTSDGGRRWHKEQTFGLRVTALETAGSRAFAVLASCQGSGAAYAANCSTFSLYTSAAGSTSLQKIPLTIPASLRTGALGSQGQAASASLVLTGGRSGGTGYLLAPTGDVLTGPLTGSGWSYAGKAPCAPGAAAAGGAPLGAQLAVGSGSKLLLNCAGNQAGASGSGGAGSGGLGSSGGAGGSGGSGGAAGAGSARQVKTLWASSSNGAQWHRVSKPPAAGHATSLATASQGQVVLATSAGIDYSPDGTSWQAAAINGGPPAGGFSYIGMTTAQRGVAVPANATLGEVFVTEDGGQTWRPSKISV